MRDKPSLITSQNPVGKVRAVPCAACLDRMERKPGKSFCHDQTGASEAAFPIVVTETQS